MFPWSWGTRYTVSTVPLFGRRPWRAPTWQQSPRTARSAGTSVTPSKTEARKVSVIPLLPTQQHSCPRRSELGAGYSGTSAVQRPQAGGGRRRREAGGGGGRGKGRGRGSGRLGPRPFGGWGAASEYLAGGVHSEFLQFLCPWSRTQLRLLHGDSGRATASRSFGSARRSHCRRRSAGARAPGGGCARGALRGQRRRRGGLWG